MFDVCVLETESWHTMQSAADQSPPCMHALHWCVAGRRFATIGVLYSAYKRTLQARFACRCLQCLQLLHHQTDTPFITDVLPVLVLSLGAIHCIGTHGLCLPTNRHLTFSFACRCCGGYYDNIMRYVIEQ
jgi:hypothetical protein